MDRGPVALFAAIVAVGLGPAMWLGAQFGNLEVAPSSPPAAVQEQSTGTQGMLGGTGAGDNATGDDSVIRTKPRADVRPLTRTSSPRRSASPSASASASSSPSASPSAHPSDSGPSTPPAESSGPPTGEPSGGGTSGSPSTPADDTSSGNPANPGQDDEADAHYIES
jgi:hypothetical protein